MPDRYELVNGFDPLESADGDDNADRDGLAASAKL